MQTILHIVPGIATCVSTGTGRERGLEKLSSGPHCSTRVCRKAAGKYFAKVSYRKTDNTLTDGFTPPRVKRDLNCVVCVYVAVSLVISCVCV